MMREQNALKLQIYVTASSGLIFSVEASGHPVRTSGRRVGFVCPPGLQFCAGAAVGWLATAVRTQAVVVGVVLVTTGARASQLTTFVAALFGSVLGALAVVGVAFFVAAGFGAEAGHEVGEMLSILLCLQFSLVLGVLSFDLALDLLTARCVHTFRLRKDGKAALVALRKPGVAGERELLRGIGCPAVMDIFDVRYHEVREPDSRLLEAKSTQSDEHKVVHEYSSGRSFSDRVVGYGWIQVYEHILRLYPTTARSITENILRCLEIDVCRLNEVNKL
jgi:hypothetical protein